MLLEVLLALTLLAAGGAVILASLGSSARQTADLTRDAHGADLAVSILSQIQIGLIEPINDGPYPADPPHQDWTWEVLVEDVLMETEDDPEMLRVEVIVRHVYEDRTRRLVQNIALPVDELEQADPGEGF